jgi:hypothetical protein
VTEAALTGSWYQRHGAVLSELDSATLTVGLAARQLATAVTNPASDTRPGRRALRTALQRLSFALRHAAALPAVDAHDTDRQFRAGIAHWLDAVSGFRAALGSLDAEQLQRSIRSGDAANADLLAAQRSLRQRRGQAARHTIQPRQPGPRAWASTVLPRPIGR